MTQSILNTTDLCTFDIVGVTANVVLDETNSNWVVYARYEGGGLVNGFTISLDKVTNHSINEMKNTSAIKEMMLTIISLARSDLWSELA